METDELQPPPVDATESCQMNKFQAMALAMTLFSKDEINPKSDDYKTLRRLIAFKIERLGPDAALEQIRNNKDEVLAQVRFMSFSSSDPGFPPSAL